MAVSAAVRREVRWRITGTNAWSDIQSCSPVDELTLDGLNRDKTYDVEVRDIAACGAKSAWVLKTAGVPDVAVGNITLADLKTSADDAAADATAAIAELANIASDNILSQGEKPPVINDYNVIVAEQAGIDAQATAYAITTEKTAYDAAVTALTSYLATLTTPTLWSNLAGDTTIVGTTFRTKFADVYTTRQTLLNAIYAGAKSKADAAQTTATQGVGLATQLAVINGGFDVLPLGYGWTPDAGTGWYVDNTGVTPGVLPNCGLHLGGVGAATGAYRNNGLTACNPGQVYKTQGLIRAAGANGVCYMYISWRNAANAEIGTAVGNFVTGTTIAGSYAVGTAPAGTVFAQTCIAVSGHTAGYYAVDNVVCTQYPDNMDQVPDGATYARPLAVQLSSGVVLGASSGRDLVLNGTFTLNTAGLAAGSVANNQLVLDNWTATGVAAGAVSTRSAGALGNQITNAYGTIASGATIEGSHNNGARFPVSSGQQLKLTVHSQVYNTSAMPAGVTGQAQVVLTFADAAGASLTPYVQSLSGTGGGSGAPTTSVAVTAPSTAASCQIFTRLLVSNASGAGVACPAGQAWVGYFYSISLIAITGIDDEVVDGTTYGRTSQSDLYVSGGVNRVGLRVAGSGQVLGNQYNAPNSLTMTYGAAQSTTSLSATSAGAVSIAAFTIYTGSVSASYSAVTNAVTGLSVGSSYYIYCHDAGGSGGTKTWYAAATIQLAMQQGDDVVIAGKITIPSSGSSGGGGSGCPVREAWVIRKTPDGQEYCRAGDVEVGDELLLTDGRWGFVSYSQAKLQPCVRVVGDGGYALSCSESGPLGKRGGGSVLAPAAIGEQIRTRRDGGDDDRIASVESIGQQWVQHITCEDDFFWTGDDQACLFSHHNIKPP